MVKIKGWKVEKHHRARPNTKMGWINDNGDTIEINYQEGNPIPYRLIYNGIREFDSTGTFEKAKKIAIHHMKNNTHLMNNSKMIEYRVSRKSSTQGMYFQTDKGDDVAVGIGRIMWINKYGPADDITIQEWKPRGKFLKQ